MYTAFMHNCSQLITSINIRTTRNSTVKSYIPSIKGHVELYDCVHKKIFIAKWTNMYPSISNNTAKKNNTSQLVVHTKTLDHDFL